MNHIQQYASTRFGRFPKTFSEFSDLRREVPWWNEVLDPGSPTLTKWNYIILFTCLVALFLDPLYFFLPVIGAPGCMQIDLGLGIFVTFFRTVADLFFFIHITIKFRTAFVAPSSRVFGRGELVMDRRAIAMRYLKSSFIVDLAAALPLPQVSHSLFHYITIIFFVQYPFIFPHAKPYEPQLENCLNNNLQLEVC